MVEPRPVELWERAFIIVNMEPYPSRWVIAEYTEASRVAREHGYRLIVAGASPQLRAILSRRSVEATGMNVYSLCRGRLAVTLDLWADRVLEPWEAASVNCILVGGIMGDHPPRGRGMLLSLENPWAPPRSLGPWQLSVDGTVKLTLQAIQRGVRPDMLEVVEGVSLEVDAGLGKVTVELPFAYPLRDGKPWISGELVRLLARGIAWDEEALMR